MTNDILNAISRALGETFGELPIYFEKVEQHFKEPCFFLNVVNEEEQPLLGNRAKRDTLLDVMYFPKNGKEECLQIASKLYPLLKCIQLFEYNNSTENIKYTDKLNGHDLNYHIEDSVLHFFVNYRAIVYYPTVSTDKMSEITRNVGVTNGR